MATSRCGVGLSDRTVDGLVRRAAQLIQHHLRQHTVPPERSEPTMFEPAGHCSHAVERSALDGPAMICSFECTFCTSCSSEMAEVCPNCSGRLVLRPPRGLAVDRSSDSMHAERDR